MKIKPLNKRQLVKLAPKEDDDLKLFAIYLTRRFGEHGFHHSANERKTSRRYGVELRAKGQKKGFPDVIIFVTPTNRQRWDGDKSVPFKGMVIELKRITGGVLTAEQQRWMIAMGNHGWAVGLCYGLNEAIKAVEQYYGKG